MTLSLNNPFPWGLFSDGIPPPAFLAILKHGFVYRLSLARQILPQFHQTHATLSSLSLALHRFTIHPGRQAYRLLCGAEQNHLRQTALDVGQPPGDRRREEVPGRSGEIDGQLREHV